MKKETLHFADFGVTSLVNPDPIKVKKIDAQVELWAGISEQERSRNSLKAEKLAHDLGPGDYYFMEA